MLTPLHIQMLLHYYAIATQYAVNDPDHRASRAVQKFRRDLYRRGLIEPSRVNEQQYIVLDEDRAALFADNPAAVSDDHGHFRATERGAAHVRKLCNAEID